MGLAKFSIIVGGVGDWEMGGADGSTGGHGGVDRMEDLTDDEAGGKSRKGTTLDTAFGLRKHVTVKVDATVPECSRIVVAEVVERKKIVKSRVRGHDVAA